MAKHRTHRTHSIAFKRQVVQEYLAGETLHGLAHRHDLSRTPIRIWVEKYEAGAVHEDAEAAGTIQEYEARIAALERLAVERSNPGCRIATVWGGVRREARRSGHLPAHESLKNTPGLN